jgi:hypothetical protein
MNLDQTLKSVIQAATGFPVYALEKPVEKTVPAVVYKIIADMPILATDATDTKLSWARVQLTHVADTYAKLKSLVEDTETVMFAKTTDWQVSVPLSTKLEDKEDNLYYSIREYSIWYTKD